MIKIILILILLATATPARRRRPAPPIEHLFPVKMGLHNPDPLYGQYGCNEYGFAIAITSHNLTHYENGSLAGVITIELTDGETWNSRLWLHVKVENLVTGEVMRVNWQQTEYEFTRDAIRYGNGTTTATVRLASPCLALRHARVTLYPTCDIPVLQYCQW